MFQGAGRGLVTEYEDEHRVTMSALNGCCGVHVPAEKWQGLGLHRLTSLPEKAG